MLGWGRLTWDILQKSFEESRGRDLKKEGHDKTLKRAQFQNSSVEDQQKTSQLRALTLAVIKEDATQQRRDLLEENLLDYQSRSDSKTSACDNQIVHISSTEKGNKDQIRKLEESRATIQDIVQTEVSKTRMTI